MTVKQPAMKETERVQGQGGPGRGGPFGGGMVGQKPLSFGRSIKRLLKRLHNMAYQTQGLFQSHRAFRDTIAQGPAVHILHNNKILAFRGADFMNSADVCVVQTCGRPGFTQNPILGRMVLLLIGGEKLNGDHALQRCVLGKIHVSHSPTP